MAFVFYDTETTGISTDFDQILQFAAIRTDADLNEIERFEMRCRLLPHVIPHPAALKVTGMTIARATDPSLPCHYEMIRAIQVKMAEWSPAIFVGYNSLNFDEHLLRQALFRTLHEPYLTNTNGNCRADVMTLVQAASQFSPECVVVPTGAKGNAVFKLDQLAPANGFSHENAHDALADVEATIHMAKCVRERAPECWSRFVRFSSKAGVNSFIESEEAFVLTEFYFNRPYHYVLAPLGADPDNPAAQLCLDLRHDLNWVSSLSDAQLAVWVAKSPKPVRKLRANAAPSIAPIDDAPRSFLGALDEAAIAAAASRLQQDDGLRGRLIEAVVSGRDDFAPSPHVEEQIYTGFIPDDDKPRMETFHLVPWQNRVAIVDTFEDERLRYYGYRLIHERHPELLAAEIREFYRSHDSGRLMDASGTAKWNTLLIALAAIGETRVGCSEEQAHMLDEYEAYLQARIAAGG
jgi:exodeoxyribonuclease-1